MSDSGPHDVVFASQDYIECRCGNISITMMGHDAHLHDVGRAAPFDPSDPTEDPLFNPANWTGTVSGGLISSRAECGVCGRDWHEGPCGV